GQPVRRAACVVAAAFGRHRKLILVGEARVEERARAVHLGRADIGVPVGHRAETGPGVQVDAGETECGWDERSSLAAVRTQRLAVLVELGVEAPGAPACGQ